MINSHRTLEVFGINILKEKVNQLQKVIHNCDCCGIERPIQYNRAIKKNYFCHKCLMTNKNPMYDKKVIFQHSGKNNHNYIDGRTINPTCKYPGCNQRINKNTPGKGGMCHKHGHLGEKNGRYIDGRTPFYQLIRGCYQMRQWSEAVRKKDDYTCVECGKTGCELHAHHKKPLVQIISEFLDFYKHFNPLEQKEILLQLSKNWEELWDINNGDSLCEDCHKLEHLIKEHLIDRSNV